MPRGAYSTVPSAVEPLPLTFASTDLSPLCRTTTTRSSIVVIFISTDVHALYHGGRKISASTADPADGRYRCSFVQ
jgi:hypothetical protein